MSLGLTLKDDNLVTVFFAEDGVYLPVSLASETSGYPDVKKHIETLKEMGCRIIAEKESLKERGLQDRPIDAEVISRKEIDQIIFACDSVIGF